MKIISVQRMKELDQAAIAAGTPGTLLMARAGRGVRDAVTELMQWLHPRFCTRITVVAGKGNNGGDAFAAAALLAEEIGISVTVYSVAPVSELGGDPAYFAASLPQNVNLVEIGDQLPETALKEGTVILDGLLGTGIKGSLKEPYKSIISQINASGLPVVSIDIPSGLDGDSGEVATAAVSADITATMAFPKRGLLSDNGIRYCGRLRCVDIGIPARLAEESADTCGDAVFAGDAAGMLPDRPPDSHKRTCGQALVIGGSKWYGGAPVLSGTAALRSGTGLVTVAVPESIRSWFAQAAQALIFLPAPDDGTGFLNRCSIESLLAAGEKADSIILGPGIGQTDELPEVVKAILQLGKPSVIDADALRLIATDPGIISAGQTSSTVLTPHPGEMKMLLNAFDLANLVNAGRREQALALAEKLTATVVLKGPGTVIATPEKEIAINTSGSHALSTAGTGDVLSGLIGGLTAQGISPATAAKLGTFIHGRAAEMRGISRRSLIADDLLDAVGDVFHELTPDA